MYFNGNEALTYNCIFNFIVGNRGGGKSYWFKDYAIRDYLKNKKQFIYLRRFETEIDKGKKEKFFDDIKDKFPDHEFKVKGHTAFIDGEEAGQFMVLSTAKLQKSVPFPNVNKIGFDEFILDKGYHHYLPDEVTNFLEFYETIARLREDVRVFFMANAVSITNPYFLYWGIRNVDKMYYRPRKHMLVVRAVNEDFVKMKKKTKFGEIVEGTAYGRYAIENEYLRDDDSFIGKKTGNSHYSYSLVYNGRKYGVWIDYKMGKYYISNDIDESNKLSYSITMADHSPNTMLLKGKSYNMQQFVRNYKLGNVIFEDMHIKNVCYEIIRLFLL